jgi:hypothetical protein
MGLRARTICIYDGRAMDLRKEILRTVYTLSITFLTHRCVSFYLYTWCHRDILRVFAMGQTPICRNLQLAKDWLERIPSMPLWLTGFDVFAFYTQPF